MSGIGDVFKRVHAISDCINNTSKNSERVDRVREGAELDKTEELNTSDSLISL